MDEVRAADVSEARLLADIAAAGFFDDPVMMWVFPDDATRLDLLKIAFHGLVRDFLPDRGTVHVLDNACVTMWRPPHHDYSRIAGADGGAGETATPDQGGSPFPADVVERFGILGEAMEAVHPHERHWYLNVISTVPVRQGQGLGARALIPVLARCDADGVPAYLESSNPRNMSLYRRHGFEETSEIKLPDGPSLYAMWRPPVGST
jgi:GNAT superfamily N-acetyltransferase